MQHSGQHKTRWSLRVTAWLVALALVPVVGAGWLAWSDLRSIGETRRQAEQISEATDDLIRLTELNVRLLDERNWVSASAAVDELGVPEEFVATTLNVDIPAEVERTITSVDELMDGLGFDRAREQLVEARRTDGKDLLDVGFEYEDIAAQIDERTSQSFDRIMRVAGDTRDAASLVDALVVLEGARDASQAVTIQFTAYYGAQFAGAESMEQVQRLASEQARYDAAVAQMQRIAPADSYARSKLEEIVASRSVQRFQALVSAVIVEPPESNGELSAVLASLNDVLDSFSTGAESVEAHLDVVDAAYKDIQFTSGEIETTMLEAQRSSLTRIATLIIASLLFALGLARAIGRPLRELAQGAKQLRDGKGSARVRPSGPREVREAILALNEAAGHIDLAGRQAEALSSGQLDSPVLDENAPGALGESLQDAVQTLASSLNQREELALQLRHEATHDNLTNLANRGAALKHIRKSLAEAESTNKIVALTFVDLDNFKLVNDHHGHPMGDKVLSVLGRRLARHAGECDMIGRLGGDEFIIVTTCESSLDDIVDRARTWLNIVSTPITVGNTTVRLSGSAGVAISDGLHGVGPEELLRDADLAVYKAKSRPGRDGIEVCDDELRSEQAYRAEIEAALRNSIDHQIDELTLHYQPVVDAATGRVVSAEALLRWHPADRAAVSPGEFIPIAERSNLILDLDLVVMSKAADQLALWSGASHLADLTLSINTSAGHIATHTFVDDVIDAIEGTGIDPKRVVIEVTESALLDDLGGAAEKLSVLRDRGIRVAIDDFGTGYTSLGQLRRLPVDILKIDRSFVADESASGLVELIISMGHLLGATVIAEGIETQEQANRLIALGADQLQGFLFGRPVEAAAFAQDHAAKLFGASH